MALSHFPHFHYVQVNSAFVLVNRDQFDDALGPNPDVKHIKDLLPHKAFHKMTRGFIPGNYCGDGRVLQAFEVVDKCDRPKVYCYFYNTGLIAITQL